jgi:hypothetical protein
MKFVNFWGGLRQTRITDPTFIGLQLFNDDTKMWFDLQISICLITFLEISFDNYKLNIVLCNLLFQFWYNYDKKEV